MMEVIRSYETSVLTRATRRHITESGILHSHRREKLRSYVGIVGSNPTQYMHDFSLLSFLISVTALRQTGHRQRHPPHCL
jgi:hypothetical protein